MDNAGRRVRISVGPVSLEAELKSNKTADAIYEALPIETTLNTWGEEFYFKIPGVKDHRETATTHVKVGDVAFWGAGGVLAIFFGRTPMSSGPDPVPVDRVNIVGRILGDPTQLRQAMSTTKIKVEKI
ncbi:MAG: cyclophilin-like fold protein [Nitrospiraceae bacterium]